jgi:acyl-coenzyme A thioesterase PaaI-like protein
MATSVSGLELLQGLQERGPAAVGVGGLLGMRIEAVEPGVIVFGIRTDPQFANPHGGLHGGITATLLDSAMGCAVLSQLPPRRGLHHRRSLGHVPPAGSTGRDTPPSPR